MLTDILYIVLGGFVLSLIHAAIPNHWLPILTFAKTNSWNKVFMNTASIVTAFFHSLSTIIIGTLIGVAGIFIWQNYEIIAKLLASGIFIITGLTYISMHVFNVSKHHHHHGKEFHIYHDHIPSITLTVILVIAMFALSVYYYILKDKSIGITLVTISLASFLSMFIIFLISNTKHIFSYRYHIHQSNDGAIHLHYLHHNHSHIEHTHENYNFSVTRTGNLASIAGLSLALFLSPCTEIEMFYLHAAKLGIYSVVLLSLIYLLTTVFVTLTLVNLGNAAIQKFNLNKLEHNEDIVTGIVMIILGILFPIL